MTMSFDERVVEQTTGALELFGIYLGDRLGLYTALREEPGMTAPALAARCRIHPRYAREWLEQQAVAGVLEADDASSEADTRRYRLPEAHAAALTEPSHLAHVAPLARMVRASAPRSRRWWARTRAAAESRTRATAPTSGTAKAASTGRPAGSAGCRPRTTLRGAGRPRRPR